MVVSLAEMKVVVMVVQKDVTSAAWKVDLMDVNWVAVMADW